MPTNTRPQQTLEPVHVRPASVGGTIAATAAPTESVAPVPTEQAKPAAATPPAAVHATVQKSQPAKVKKPPKQSSGGVGGAIFATVVIVLGLAGLAVFAYIKTQK
jgi:uncharacterized protein HemX